MIIDSHSWITKTEHWGKQTGDLMDQSWKASDDYSKNKKIHQKTGVVGRYASVDELVQMMDEAGVDKTLLHSWNHPFWDVKIPNEWNADQVKQCPDRLFGLGSVYELDGQKAVRELEEIHSLGLLGIKMGTRHADPIDTMDLDTVDPFCDERMWPLYDKCIDLDLAVFVHVGWIGTMVMGDKAYADWELNRVHYLDRVAVQFPKLKLVAVHAGVSEWKTCLMLMLKNVNLYCNTSALGGHGLIPLEEYALLLKNAKALGVLHKVMWGTDNYDQRDELPLVKSIPEITKKYNIGPTMPDLTQEDMDAFLGGNTAKFLNVK